MKPNLFRGTIHWLFTSRGSGMAILGIEDDRRRRVLVPCATNATVRALDHALGGTVIVSGEFDAEAIQGARLFYTLDSVGVLEGFTIEADAGPELIAEYEKQRSKRRKGRVVDRGLLPPDDRIFSISLLATRPLCFRRLECFSKSVDYPVKIPSVFAERRYQDRRLRE